jgi:hypothetical protein
MKPTKANCIAFLKAQLSSNEKWALKALQRIYEGQTSSEKKEKETNELNGIGFSGADAEILSSFAEQLNKRGFLTEKQLQLLFKRIPKYAAQLWALADQDKIRQMVAN